MIAFLSGTVRARTDDALIVDVGGVGYRVTVPVGVAGDAGDGDAVELHVHTYVREDQLALFGFDAPEQLTAFETLLGVSGVGPRLAVAILGGLAPADLAEAVEVGDIARLKSVKGVGKRLAERLTVELKGKIAVGSGVLPTAGAGRGRGANRAEPPVWRDLRSALANLQYRPKEVDGVVDQLRHELPDAAFDVLLRAALGILKKA